MDNRPFSLRHSMYMNKAYQIRNWLGSQQWLAPVLWFGLSIVVAVKEVMVDNMNDYTIFKYVFLHTIHGQPLYPSYPEYFDVNMYGPIFSLIIAPFTLLPDKLSAVLWVVANAAFLYIAVRRLPLSRIQQNLVLLFSSHELMNASSYFQINPAITACIMLSFVCINNGKDFWAAFFIVFATMVKLYGIVGLAFFFFSRNRLQLIGSLLLWSALLFVLPMFISSPSFIVSSYHEWILALVEKNKKNYRFFEGVELQNISVMGVIQRIFRLKYLSNLWVLVPALILFGLQYLRLGWKQHPVYRLYLLCSVLIFTVIFSTSSESPTYIIAFPAACIWYVLQAPVRWNNVVFLLVFILGGFSHSDLVTPWVRHNIMVPYAVKAMPFIALWLVIVFQIYTKQFLRVAVKD